MLFRRSPKGIHGWRRSPAIKDTCDEKVAPGMGGGAAVDAVVVATAEASPGRTVITGDPVDLRKLAAHSDNVRVIDYRDVPAG